jgi:hypothetical protein
MLGADVAAPHGHCQSAIATSAVIVSDVGDERAVEIGAPVRR